jgi:CRP-like cAMP-binding protein
VEEQERRRLARRAADISLEPGEWLIREGEEPRFYVILEGELEAIQDIVGQRRVLGRSSVGDFSGETPIFMVLPALSPYAPLQHAALPASSASNCRNSSAIAHRLAR